MARPLPSDPVLLAGERDRLDHPEWESGGGGLLSTITDYQRFSQMLLNGGEFEGKRYLSPAVFKAMTTGTRRARSPVASTCPAAPPIDASGSQTPADVRIWPLTRSPGR